MAYQRKDRWTAKQEAWIRENWEKMRDEDMATVLGRTLKSVRHKRQRLALEKAEAGRGVVISKQVFEKNKNSSEPA